MKLSEWAHISEIVGAVAIIASLIFVGSEIRQNTNALRTATTQSIAEQINTINLEYATDENLPRLFALMFEGKSQDAFSPTDQVRLEMAILVGLRRIENIYLQVEEGVLHKDALSRVGYTFYQNNFTREYWKGARADFDAKFRPFMDKKLEES